MKIGLSARFLCLLLLPALLARCAAQDKPRLVVQTGHTATVNAVAFSPDGKTLVSGSLDKTIIVWDLASGKELRSLVGHTNSVSALAFSSDGKTLASSSWDGTIKLWDMDSGTLVRTLARFRVSMNALALDQDGALLVCGGDDGVVRLLNASTGESVQTFKGHTGSIASVAISPDGGTLASGSDDGTVRLWDVKAGTSRTVQESRLPINGVVFSPDGSLLAVAAEDKTVRLWDVATGKARHTLQGHTAPVRAVAFRPDGAVLASVSQDETVKLWDVPSGRDTHTLTGHTGNIASVAFSSDGKTLATGSRDKTIRLWAADTGAPVAVLEGRTATIYSVAFQPNSKLVAASSWDGEMRLWDGATGKAAGTLEARSSGTNSAAFNPDGSLLAGASSEGMLTIIDLATGKARNLANHTNGVGCVAFSTDGKTLAAATDKQTIGLWNVAGGRLLHTLQGHTDNVNCLAFSPDGNLLASGSDDGTVRIWDAQTGAPLHTLTGHKGWVFAVAFRADSKMVASGSWDNTIKLWDATTGQEIRTLRGHTASVESVAFSPDGNMLASGSWDNTVRLWDPDTGTLSQTLTGHTGSVESVVWSADGKALASGGMDATTRLWHAATGKEICSRVAFGDDDWVVVTPDGRFDGTPEGIKHLHWVQGNRPMPLESFYEDFFTPSLLPRVLAQADDPLPPVQFDITQGIQPPPAVRILSPQAGQSFDKDTVDVQVEAVDQGGGIDQIRLYQNGKLVNDTQRRLEEVSNGSKTIVKTFTISLIAGANTLRATALNTQRTESSPVQIEIGCTATLPDAELYILAVGIDDYQNPSYHLDYARPDAQAIAAQIAQRAQGLFKQTHAVQILDKDATRDGIEKAFRNIIAHARPQDAFIFYYSGHGAMSDGATGQAADFYIVAQDVLELHGDQGLTTRGVSATQLREWCRQVPAQKQLIVLDACQSGGALRAFATRGLAEEEAVYQLAHSVGVVVLTASLTDQPATEFADLKHGAFTYVLLQGMNGDAGKPDGRITPTKLKAYVEAQLPPLVQKYRGSPQYAFGDAYGQDFPIGLIR